MKRLRASGPELLIVFGGLLYVALGRGRWATVERDHGFWYSAAQSMLAGGRAMRDVRLQYGPVSLWILEGVCRTLGTRVSTIVAFQFLLGLAAIVGLQVLSRRFLMPDERWLSAAIIVPLIVWMVGPGNLLYPCAFPMSHAFALGVADLLIGGALLGRAPLAGATVAGAIAGLTFLTKQEFGAAAFLGVVAMVAASPVPLRKKIAGVAIAAAALAVTYFATLILVNGLDSFGHLVRANVLWPWVPVPASWKHLFTRYMGLDRPADRLREMFDTLISLAAFGGTVWVLLYVRARWKVFGAALGAAWLLWVWRWSEGSHFLPMTLALPAILCSTAIMLANRRRSHRLSSPERRGAPDRPGSDAAASARDWGVMLAVAAGALVLLQREGYRGSIEGYYSGMGYVFAIPVISPLLWLLMRGPAGAGRRRTIAVVVVVGCLAAFGLGRLRALAHEWKSAVALPTPRGTIYVSRGFAPIVADTTRFIETRTRPGDPILMVPSSLGLDFMLDRRDLSFFPYVVPGYLPPESEAELIVRLATTPPRAAIVFGNNLGLLRSGDYGRGFADAVMEWLRKNLPHQESFAGGVRYWGS